MAKFLGMPITRKPLTDAEYVARERRELQRGRRYGKWLLLFLAAAGIAFMSSGLHFLN